jgi:preprotein translocase SecE subunit
MPSVKDESSMASKLTSGASEPDDEKDSRDTTPEDSQMEVSRKGASGQEDSDEEPSGQAMRSASVPARSGKVARSQDQAGFFTIYKSGQGYWTRMGTAAAGALLGLLTAGFLYRELPVPLTQAFTPANLDTLSNAVRAEAVNHATIMARNATLVICVLFLAAYSAFVFWFMNKPTNAEFMIATDSEMKKVNWTSRKELIGSTQVVIGFMFLIAFLLFGLDVVFGYFFKLITVLKAGPFG